MSGEDDFYLLLLAHSITKIVSSSQKTRSVTAQCFNQATIVSFDMYGEHLWLMVNARPLDVVYATLPYKLHNYIITRRKT